MKLLLDHDLSPRLVGRLDEALQALISSQDLITVFLEDGASGLLLLA